ncbi:MAG TPA: universal stress protein [Armatimonadota bacterium]|nr:universal stress protein [Armatimonadota bacterium]
MMHNRLIRKILLATDGSELAMRAGRYAAEIAGCTGADVTILNTAEVSGVTEFVTYSIEAGRKPSQQRETGEDIVEKARKPFLDTGVPTHTKIIEGYAAEVILGEAEDGKYDLIVMGSRGAGMGLIRRVVFGLGSVAERVIANAPCPVLVVRGED